jgi:hypothetical protein
MKRRLMGANGVRRGERWELRYFLLIEHCKRRKRLGPLEWGYCRMQETTFAVLLFVLEELVFGHSSLAAFGPLATTMLEFILARSVG